MKEEQLLELAERAIVLLAERPDEKAVFVVYPEDRNDWRRAGPLERPFYTMKVERPPVYVGFSPYFIHQLHRFNVYEQLIHQAAHIAGEIARYDAR